MCLCKTSCRAAGSTVSSSSWNLIFSSRETTLRAALCEAEAKVKVKSARSTQQKKRCWILDILVDWVLLSASSLRGRPSLLLGGVEDEKTWARACFSGSWILGALVEAIASEICGKKALELKMKVEQRGCKWGLVRCRAEAAAVDMQRTTAERVCFDESKESSRRRAT